MGDAARIATAYDAAERGDPAAIEQLFSSLYRELHSLAKRQLYRGAYGATLSATTLLHEAYMDLAGSGVAFPDRARFFAYAARAMRGLIIDYIRQRRALKRGGGFQLTTLDTVGESVPSPDEMSKLNDALAALERTDVTLAGLVDLKFFCGFSFAEIAALRGVSERTVQRDWSKARLLLHDMLRDE
jgi:RNA polymerase sigma factor (TIGR02999 family)